jgi:hypothetical protein
VVNILLDYYRHLSICLETQNRFRNEESKGIALFCRAFACFGIILIMACKRIEKFIVPLLVTCVQFVLFQVLFCNSENMLRLEIYCGPTLRALKQTVQSCVLGSLCHLQMRKDAEQWRYGELCYKLEKALVVRLLCEHFVRLEIKEGFWSMKLMGYKIKLLVNSLWFLSFIHV